MGIFEFDDFVAVHADEVVVGGAFDEIGVVDFGIGAEVEFTKEAAFDEEWECAIDGGAGDGGVDGAGALEEFFSAEVVGVCKGSFDDSGALGGISEATFCEEFLEVAADFCQELGIHFMIG